MSDQKYIVIIEWGGQAPPNRWYSWLYKLASLHVRTGQTTFVQADEEEEISVLAQRATEKGVIAQEGAIICASESLANTIANLAAKGLKVSKRGKPDEIIKPRDVLVGPFTPRAAVATPQDEEALARISAGFGRKGRKPTQTETFTVCCMEERRTYLIEGHTAVNCPSCGCTNVKITRGTPVNYKDPGGSIFEAWLRTRFAVGQFFVPLAGGEMEPPATPKITDLDATQFIANLIASPLLQQIATVADREDAFQILDAAYIARNHIGGEQRLRQRVEAATIYLRAGGNPMTIALGEAPDRYDLLDAAIMGPAYIAGLIQP